MTPRDFALEIEPGASPARLNDVERVLRKMLADELCRVAARIDEEDRERHIRFPPEAAQICREEANKHLYHT
jgi:hypothetical protein